MSGAAARTAHMRIVMLAAALFCSCVQYAPGDATSPLARAYKPVGGTEWHLQNAIDRINASAPGADLYISDEGTPVELATEEQITRLAVAYAEAEGRDTEELLEGSCGVTFLFRTKLVGGDRDGQSFVTGARIMVAFPVPDGCWVELGSTIEHELIHSLRRDLVSELQDDHTATGLFAARQDAGHMQEIADGHTELDAPAREKVCEAVGGCLPI